MSTRLRTRVWLPALGATLVAAALLVYVRRDRTLEHIDPATIEQAIGRHARLKGFVTESGRILLHRDGERIYYLGGDHLQRPSQQPTPPRGHNVLLTGRINQVVNAGWTKHEWQVWLRDVGVRDLGPPPPAPPQPERPQPAAVRIEVTAKQWEWWFRYPNGGVSRELHLPRDRPVRLDVTSADVIHAMRLQLPGGGHVGASAVPGGEPQPALVTPRQTGRSRLHCGEYCGSGHSTCGADVVVEGLPDFELWMNRLGPVTQPVRP